MVSMELDILAYVVSLYLIYPKLDILTTVVLSFAQTHVEYSLWHTQM